MDEERAAGNGGVDGVRVDFLEDNVGDLKGWEGGGGWEKNGERKNERCFVTGWCNLKTEILCPTSAARNIQSEGEYLVSY